MAGFPKMPHSGSTSVPGTWGVGGVPLGYSPQNVYDEGKDLLEGISVDKAKKYKIDAGAFKDPYHDANAGRFWGGADAAAGRTGNTEFRAGQAGLISTLQDAVAGRGTSVAESTLRGGADRALAGSMALQASGANATNPSLAMRAVGHAQAGIGQNLARDAATLRASEIAQARGELGNVLGQARGGDLTQQGMNDQLVSKYLELGFSNDQAQFQAAKELEALRVQNSLGTAGINAGIGQGNQQFWGQLAGAGAGAAGAAFAASDEKTKKNVQPGGDEVRAFLDKIAAKGFDYQTPGAPGQTPGRHAGVMAQDLERAGPIGAGMVGSVGGTKMVDAGQAAGAALAGTADINARLRRLEGTQPNERERLRSGAGEAAAHGAASGVNSQIFGAQSQSQPQSQPNEREMLRSGAAPSKPSVGRRMLDWIMSGEQDRQGVTAGVGG